MSEKTEKPTPKKIRDARKKGQVAKSKEIPSLALMLTALFWLLLDSKRAGEKLTALFDIAAQLQTAGFPQSAEAAITQSLLLIGQIVLPFLLLVACIGVFSHLLQTGPLFAPESVKPDIKKIDPLSGAKKIFSKKNLIAFMMSVLKVLIFGITVSCVIYFDIPTLARLPYANVNAILPVASDLFILLTLYLTTPLAIIAILDFLFQKHNHEKELKMSKDEVKREHKDNDGSPEIKQKRRDFHKELQAGGMPKQLENTTMVVANPTHLVVGLYYDRLHAPVPVISLKYSGEQARTLKKLAEKQGVPVLENVPLARGLFGSAKTAEPIPREHFEAVAQALKWLNSLS